MGSNLKVQIPQAIVRNSKFKLSAGEFLLYARLKFLHFRQGEGDTIILDHTKLRMKIGITDTRTLKKYLKILHKYDLIKSEHDKIPKTKHMEIIFNPTPKNLPLTPFTQLSAKVFNWTDRLDPQEFRLLFYIKSYLSKERHFAFMGYERITKELGISSNKISECCRNLKKAKLVKIEKHKLSSIDEWDENDELIISRYPNHYYVLEDNL